MKYVLYPQLPIGIASELAREHAAKSVGELTSRSRTHHEKATFSATGGSRITTNDLARLAASVRRLRDQTQVRQAIDSKLGRLLHSEMPLSRGEAALEGIWAFLGCVLMPDVVRWRFDSTEPTPVERFVGGSRGVRSVFGRCWWRGELLYDEARRRDDPYWLLEELIEDELTGLIDRQRSITSRRVAVALARSLVETDTRGVARMNVARDGFKRYQRLSAFVCFEALHPEELRIACDSIFIRAVKALQAAENPSESTST